MTPIPKIKDHMAKDLLVFTPEMDVVRATQLLLKHAYSGAPVVDEQRRVIGVLAKKDCLRAALNAAYHQQWGGAVGNYMNAPVETLDENADLVEAAEHFLQSNYRRFPVVSQGGLVGQVSRADILAALVEHWELKAGNR